MFISASKIRDSIKNGDSNLEKNGWWITTFWYRKSSFIDFFYICAYNEDKFDWLLPLKKLKQNEKHPI
jgi:hypothetical protein